MSKKISDYIISKYGNNWGTETLHVLSLEKLDDGFFNVLTQEMLWKNAKRFKCCKEKSAKINK